MAGELTAIVGNGCIAAAAGWALNQIGQPFYVIGREGPRAWNYSFDSGDSEVRISSSVPHDWIGKTALMLVCVKAFDLAAAFTHLAPFDAQIAVVSFANGATRDLLNAAAIKFPRHLFRPGFSTVGCTRSGDNVFSSRSTTGRFQFGPLSSIAGKTPAEHNISRPNSLFVWNESIEIHQRRKWLFNTVINTISAAQKFSENGRVLEDISYLSAVFDESYSLGVEHFGAWPLSRQDLYTGMIKLIQDTENNENSMAVDVRLGRKTETDFLAGLALKNSSKYPLLTSMHQRIVKA